MRMTFVTVLAGYLLLTAGCGRPAFDPVQYRQEQKNQRIFLQSEVRALEYPNYN